MAEAPTVEQFNLRTGRILNPDAAVILLEDPVIAAEDIPYTVIAIWKRGNPEWYRGSIEQNGVSIAVVPPIGDREKQLVIVGTSGKSTVMDSKGVTPGIIRQDYDFSAAALIEGSAVAVGINGSVNRLIDRDRWADLSQQDVVNEVLEGVCPYPQGGFLVCGWSGLIAHFGGKSVERCETGTNVILTGAICDESGEIHACGQRGTILRGTKDALVKLELPETEDFWSIVRYQGKIHVASTNALYRLRDDDTLELVKFEDEVIPTSFYHLDVYQDTHLLSVGMKDAVIFDGSAWTRIL
jgi:hypothetical protein